MHAELSECLSPRGQKKGSIEEQSLLRDLLLTDRSLDLLQQAFRVERQFHDILCEDERNYSPGSIPLGSCLCPPAGNTLLLLTQLLERLENHSYYTKKSFVCWRYCAVLLTFYVVDPGRLSEMEKGRNRQNRSNFDQVKE